MSECGLLDFLESWNKMQGFDTPAVHRRMMRWLEKNWLEGNKRLLLMAFRACGKSTLVAIFTAWLLCREPDLRILVLAAEASLAGKMVRNIRKIIEVHPDTVHLLPAKKEQWGSDRFTVCRGRALRDPSVLACGMTGNMTGNRADIIIYDDVEVPNTSNTSEKRKSLRERLAESNFILTPDGTQLYVGTPHSFYSIYAKTPRRDIGESSVFLAGFRRYEQPILNAKKKSVWPELFSDSAIKRIKRQTGPNRFAAQMMLKPVNLSKGRLNSSLLNIYCSDLEWTEVQRRTELKLEGRKIVSASAWWDPAFGGHGNDSSVLAILYSDADGSFFLHHLAYINVDVKEGEDEATQQCRFVAQVAADYLLPAIAVETNGLGKFLPEILKRELAARNLPCAVLNKVSTKAKHERILEAFDVVLAARALYVHDSVRDTPFLIEMNDWRPDRNNARDDGLDAVAGALSMEPVRLQRNVVTAQRKWLPSGGMFKARTDFKL